MKKFHGPLPASWLALLRLAFRRLRRDAAVVVFYALIWLGVNALEYRFVELSGEIVWRPLMGVGFAFMIYFGPRIGWWEALWRWSSAALIWGFDPGWQRILGIVMSVGVEQVLARPVRRALLFEGRLTAPRVQAVFLGTSILLPAVRSLMIDGLALMTGQISVEAYVPALRKDWAGDMIGILAMTPFTLLVICPILQKRWRFSRQPKESTVPSLLGDHVIWHPFRKVLLWGSLLTAYLLALAMYDIGPHYRFWFLAVPIVVMAMVVNGFELGLCLIPLLCMGLSLLETHERTGVALGERQVFLATVASLCFVFGALLFERKRVGRLLQAASRDALRVGEAKSNFMSMVSHELRTPLVTILGCARLAQDLASDSPRRRVMEGLARDNAQKMLKLIDRVLLLARHPVQDPGRDLRQVDIEDLLSAAQKECLAKIGSKPVQCDVQVAESARRMVYTDARKLRLALNELIDNAVKFTTHGHIRLEARITHAHGHGHADDLVLQIEVIDSGAGIAPSKHADVFRLFHQEDQSRGRAFGGMGAGLSYAHLLAESLGGNITLVHSAPGEGSHFRFQFPA